MVDTVFNEVALLTGIMLILFLCIWLELCRQGFVRFPVWMVNLFPGYNIKRAWRQAEHKLRWAEERRCIGESRWIKQALQHHRDMTIQKFKGKKIESFGCTVIVGGRIYTDPNPIDMPEHHSHFVNMEQARQKGWAI